MTIPSNELLIGYDYDAWYGYSEKVPVCVDASLKNNTQTLICGMSGSGKSYLVNQYLARICLHGGEDSVVYFSDFKQDDSYSYLKGCPRYYPYDKTLDALEEVYEINFLGLDLTVMPGDVWKDFFTGGWPVIGVVLIPFVSGALSFLQSKVSMSGNVAAEGNDAAARSNRMMMWMMPLMSLWIGFTLPAALGVYWIVNSLLYAIQEKVLTKYYKSHMEDELSEKEKQKRDDRLRRMEAAREQQRKIAAEEAEKKTLKEKRAEKQAAKATKKKNSTNESGRVGDRPYARGRSYDPEHYGE